MALHRLSLFTLLLLLATLALDPVRADVPKTPTGKAPLELLVHGFLAPTGVAVDPDGTVFFTDRKEGRLWQRASNGSLTILLDRLEQARGLVRGEDATLYLVADAFQEQQEGARSKGVLLRRTPNDGTVSIFAENFRKPKQLAFDRDNRLLLSTRGVLRSQADPAGEEQQVEPDDDEDAEDAATADAEEDEETVGPPEAFRGTVFRINVEDGQILGSHSGFRRPSGVAADEAGTLTVIAKGFKPKEPPLKGTLFQIKANGDTTVLLEGRFKRPKGLVQDFLGQFFLAVKKDPETPKDGGLLLKVTPDGTFTRFAQGFERPWGLTFDPQGNFYVTDPKAGRIYRFLAPAPPSLADHPATTREAQVTLAGTTEPEAVITVRGGKEEVTTVADAQGKFTLEVPLNPDQVNTLKVYTTGAKGEGLTSTATIATIQQQTTAPPPSIVLVVQITEPSPGSTVTADSVLVRGLVDAGGLEVGVTVNSSPAAVVGNTFAAIVPVTPETTTLTAVATTVGGASATQSVGVTVATAPTPAVMLRASPASGVAPLQVSFSLVGGPVPTAVELDREGDRLIEFTGTSLEGQSFTYAQAGVYTPSATITDSDGNRFTAGTVVQVYDRAGLDNVLQSKWTGMRGALREGRIEEALEFIAQDFREEFRLDFTALAPFLPTLGQELEGIRFVAIRGHRTQYELLSTEDGVTFSYNVEFIRDVDGIWRIAFF